MIIQASGSCANAHQCSVPTAGPPFSLAVLLRHAGDASQDISMLAITLQQEHYAQLVIEVADPQTLMAQIERMLERRMQI